MKVHKTVELTGVKGKTFRLELVEGDAVKITQPVRSDAIPLADLERAVAELKAGRSE